MSTPNAFSVDTAPPLDAVVVATAVVDVIVDVVAPLPCVVVVDDGTEPAVELVDSDVEPLVSVASTIVDAVVVVEPSSVGGSAGLTMLANRFAGSSAIRVPVSAGTAQELTTR